MIGEATVVNCPACGATHTETVFTGTEDRFGLGGSFPVRRCLGCSFLWTELPKGFDLADWYERGYWQSDDDGQPDAVPARARRFWRAWNGSPRPSRWIKSGRVLDLGCGPAYDSAEMLAEGALPIGVDTSRGALIMAGQKHVTGLQASAERLPLSDACIDAVVMSQVLEHMPEPRAVLAEATRVLKPGGRILILLPNSGSLQRRLFDTDWVNWHLPYHLWHFSAATLRTMLAKTDIEVTSCRSVSPGEWLLLSAVRRWPRLALLGKQRYQSLLVRACVAPALRLTDACGAGDCLVIEGRKAFESQRGGT